MIPLAITRGPKQHFFGYYDISPWDAAEDRILGLEADFLDRIPSPDDTAIIGFSDLRQNSSFQKFAETRAWNWQQGARLQWLGPTYDRFVIYNDRSKDGFVSVILDMETGEKRTLPLPVYSVSPDGRHAVTLNFSRLFRLRDAYGYAGVPDAFADEKVPTSDGVWLLDLKTGESKLVISLRDLCEYNPLTSMEGGSHWVDHLMFNPDGSRFCFLHRWELDDGGLYMRLFSANRDGTELHCLLDSGNFSHFGWKNPKELLGWGRLPNQLNRIRKSKWLVKNFLRPLLPLYHTLVPGRSAFRRRLVNDHYLLFRDRTDSIEKIGEGILNQDGHCTWSPDERWILTDTYPDDDRFRTLILFDHEDGMRTDIGRFYALPEGISPRSGWDESGMRCDLHPRWNRSGDKVCIDSVHEGTRQMYTLDVSAIVKNR